MASTKTSARQEFVCKDEALFYECEVTGTRLSWIISRTTSEPIELTIGHGDSVGHSVFQTPQTSAQAICVLLRRTEETLLSFLYLVYSFEEFDENSSHFITCMSNNDSDTIQISAAG